MKKYVMSLLCEAKLIDVQYCRYLPELLISTSGWVLHKTSQHATSL